MRARAFACPLPVKRAMVDRLVDSRKLSSTHTGGRKCDGVAATTKSTRTRVKKNGDRLAEHCHSMPPTPSDSKWNGVATDRDKENTKPKAEKKPDAKAKLSGQ